MANDRPRLYRRRGYVTAHRLAYGRVWFTSSGDRMEAQPGDWWVVDGDGRGRSVANEAFLRTHKSLGGDRFARIGTVHARQVSRPEDVATLEGRAQARPGTWIVTDESGNSWPVPHHTFREGYVPLDPGGTGPGRRKGGWGTHLREPGDASFRRSAWLLLAVPGAIVLLIVGVSAAARWQPSSMRWALAPDSLVTLPLAFVFIGGSLATYWWGRPKSRTARSLVGAGVIASVALVLGFMSYAPCIDGEARVLAPLAWSLALFAGELHPRAFESGSVCAGPYPLALQLARMLALGVTFAGVAVAGLTLWQSGVQRLAARRASDVDVVIGVDTVSLPVVRVLIDQARNATSRRRVVVLEVAGEGRLDHELRDAGAVVAPYDPLVPQDLASVLTHRGHPAARRIYVLSDAPDHNRRVADGIQDLLEPLCTTENTAPTVLVRLDDPRESDSWRVSHALDATGLVMDAVSATEIAAEHLVDLFLARGLRRVNVVGDGPMLLALLSDIAARRGRVGALVEANGHVSEPLPIPPPGWPGLVVDAFVDDEDTMQEWGLIRRRAESTETVEPLDVRFHHGASPAAAALFPEGDDAQTGTVFVGSPTHALTDIASRLARLYPSSVVLVPDGTVVGVATSASHGLLYRYGLSLTPTDGGLPMGGWDQMGRLQHEVYRHRTLAAGQEARPTQVPWEDLDSAVRAGNIDQLRSVLRWVRDLGYSWVSDAPEGDHALDPRVIDLVAMRMHTAWVEGKRARGFVYGAADDPHADPPTSSYLLSWEELPEPQKEANRHQVLGAVSRAKVFGLSPLRRVTTTGEMLTRRDASI